MERSGPRVLLVEDDVSVGCVVDRQLRALGWTVVAVSTGREAIGVVERGGRVDVLLVDLLLPDVDGRAVARIVTDLSPKTRVVFMSGAIPKGPLEPRTAPFLQKPFSCAELARALSIVNL